MPIRVLIVDDSAIIRLVLRRAFEADPRLEVVGMARDAYEARALIKSVKPDVLTLDVEMPRMNGLEFLEKLMRLRPMPVVMFSSITQKGAEAAITALSLGAFECIQKPDVVSDPEWSVKFCDTVYQAGSTQGRSFERVSLYDDFMLEHASSYSADPGKVVLIGASTGGVAAIETVLAGLTENCAPTVIVQHMIPDFLHNFANRLDRNFPQKVSMATHDAKVDVGHVLLAPGGNNHILVQRTANGWVCKLQPSKKVNGHRPSVDTLFNSAVGDAKHVVAALLTGLGTDGANGLNALHKAGALTIAQDAETSVIHGMPSAALELGAVDQTLPISEIGPRISDLTRTAFKEKSVVL